MQPTNVITIKWKDTNAGASPRLQKPYSVGEDCLIILKATDISVKQKVQEKLLKSFEKLQTFSL